MARKRIPPKENHERWLVSYADLVTLLFAFFVVLFASTQTDKAKAKQISEAVERALEHGSAPPRVIAILGGGWTTKGGAIACCAGPQFRSRSRPPKCLCPRRWISILPIKLLRSQLSEETSERIG